MKKKYLVLFFFSVSLFCHHDSRADIFLNSQMSEMGRRVEELIPLMMNDEKFNNPKEEKKIKKLLKEVKDNFSQVKGHFQDMNAPLMVSADVLDGHIDRLLKTFSSPRKAYARDMFLNLTSVCTSCHTLDNQQRKLFRSLHSKDFTNPLDFAEFNFVTRNYEVALESYNQYLFENDAKTIDAFRLLKVVKRSLTILLLLRPNPFPERLEKAKEWLKLYHKKFIDVKLASSEMSEYLEGLNSWKQIDKVKSFSEIEKFVHNHQQRFEQRTDSKNIVFFINLFGLIQNYLANHTVKGDENAKIFYYLSATDRALNFSYYYSFADLYLQECMNKFPFLPIAKKCFNDYKNNVEFMYTGSSGTDIPSEVVHELETYKKKIFYNTK